MQVLYSMTIVVLWMSVIVLSNGCTAGGYWSDRGRDAMDMATVQIGYGLGAKVRVGPLHPGLLADVGAGGLRGGDILMWDDFWPRGYDQPAKQDYVLGVVGFEIFGGSDASNRRGKSFGAKQAAFISYPLTLDDATDRQKSFFSEHHIVLNPAPYYSQIEVVAAAGPSIRLGVNPGEALDFLLGWICLDIYNDDLSRLKKNPE